MEVAEAGAFVDVADENRHAIPYLYASLVCD